MECAIPKRILEDIASTSAPPQASDPQAFDVGNVTSTRLTCVRLDRLLVSVTAYDNSGSEFTLGRNQQESVLTGRCLLDRHRSSSKPVNGAVREPAQKAPFEQARKCHGARSSMDRASDYGSEGYRFQSPCRAHHRIILALFSTVARSPMGSLGLSWSPLLIAMAPTSITV